MSAPLRALAAKLGVADSEAFNALVELGETHTDLLQRHCSTYRRRRKYTVPKLAELATESATTRIRNAIASAADGPLLVSELVAFLRMQETEIPEWKRKRLPPADGVPRKRGRPRKVATLPDRSPGHV